MAMRADDGSIVLAHAHDDGKRAPAQLVRFRIVDSAETSTAYEPPSQLSWIEPLVPTRMEPLRITYGHGMPDAEGNITFFATVVDGQPIPFSALRPEHLNQATVGETRIWEVTNMTMGDHK